MSLKNIGAGKAHPAFILTNSALSEIVETSDEWITTRNRHKGAVHRDEETLLEIALRAARGALIQSGVDPLDIDLIICSTIQGDYITRRSPVKFKRK